VEELKMDLLVHLSASIASSNFPVATTNHRLTKNKAAATMPFPI
jgi:hypothetical protein